MALIEVLLTFMYEKINNLLFLNGQNWFGFVLFIYKQKSTFFEERQGHYDFDIGQK